jgi:hypothetical protein
MALAQPMQQDLFLQCTSKVAELEQQWVNHHQWEVEVPMKHQSTFLQWMIRSGIL